MTTKFSKNRLADKLVSKHVEKMVEEKPTPAAEPTPGIDFNFAEHPFVVPTNKIITNADVKRFQEHSSCNEFLGFL